MKNLIFVIPVLALVACGGNSPSGPSPAPDAGRLSAPTLTAEAKDAIEVESNTADTSVFQQALARMGSLTSSAHDVSTMFDVIWYMSILHAPPSGQAFHVNSYGMFPSPTPNFKFHTTVPSDINDAGVLAFFMTAGNRECGIGTINGSTTDFVANQQKTLSIKQSYVIVGPNACFLDGQNCSASLCKFPLTTTKVRVLFGNQTSGLYRGDFALKYKWSH